MAGEESDNGSPNSSAAVRKNAIQGSSKPRMHVIDLVDNCGKHKVRHGLACLPPTCARVCAFTIIAALMAAEASGFLFHHPLSFEVRVSAVLLGSAVRYVLQQCVPNTSAKSCEKSSFLLVLCGATTDLRRKWTRKYMKSCRKRESRHSRVRGILFFARSAFERTMVVLTRHHSRVRGFLVLCCVVAGWVAVLQQ